MVSVITVVLGALAGGLVAWITPVGQFWLQKKQRRIEDVRSWRQGIAALGIDYREAVGTEWYESLRPHLPHDLVAKIERPIEPNVMVVGLDLPILPGMKGPKTRRGAIIDQLADEVGRIERQWRIR